MTPSKEKDKEKSEKHEKKKRKYKVKTVRVVNFERLSIKDGNKFSFSGEYTVTFIFDEGLPTELEVKVFIDNTGASTITDAVSAGLVEQFLATKESGIDTKPK